MYPFGTAQEFPTLLNITFLFSRLVMSCGSSPSFFAYTRVITFVVVLVSSNALVVTSLTSTSATEMGLTIEYKGFGFSTGDGRVPFFHYFLGQVLEVVAVVAPLAPTSMLVWGSSPVPLPLLPIHCGGWLQNSLAGHLVGAICLGSLQLQAEAPLSIFYQQLQKVTTCHPVSLL